MRLCVGFPLVGGERQKSSAHFSLVAATGQRAIEVRQLLREGVQGIGTPAFTPVLEAGILITATKGHALFHGHRVGCCHVAACQSSHVAQIGVSRSLVVAAKVAVRSRTRIDGSGGLYRGRGRRRLSGSGRALRNDRESTQECHGDTCK